MSTAIQVCCRFRPFSQREQQDENNNTITVDFPDSTTVHVKETNTTFTFDRVFQPSTTQAEVFQQTAKPLTRAVMEGFNATIFACKCSNSHAQSFVVVVVVVIYCIKTYCTCCELY